MYNTIWSYDYKIIVYSHISGPQTFSDFFNIMKVCEEAVLCSLMSCTSTFWKCVWFVNMGSIIKVMNVEVKNVLWRSCPFLHLESSDGVSEKLLPISTLRYSRTGCCSPSTFYALSHSLSKCWHAFCHARRWQTNDISHTSFYATPLNWRENNGTKMTSRSRKKFPVLVSETKRVKTTLPCFKSLTAADLSPKDNFDQLFNFQGPVISECTIVWFLKVSVSKRI